MCASMAPAGGSAMRLESRSRSWNWSFHTAPMGSSSSIWWSVDRAMTTLRWVLNEQGQSPWLNNLTRPHLLDDTLSRLVAGAFGE